MALQKFVDYLFLEKKYSPHTVNGYKRDVENFITFCANQFELTDIDEVVYIMIRSWIIDLSEKGIGNRSINRKVASLKAYYKFLQKIGSLKTNPLAKHKALKTANKVEIPFSETEMNQLLSTIKFKDNFDGKRDGLIIHILYVTGIRRAELIGLQLNDVDFANQSIKVLGKRNKERIIPMLAETVKKIKEYLLFRSELSHVLDENYLFLTNKGTKLYGVGVYRIVDKYLSEVSTKVKTSPHILRHTFATHLIGKGADINSVKELLGHASLASTQVYTHNNITELKKVHATAHPRGGR